MKLRIVMLAAVVLLLPSAAGSPRSAPAAAQVNGQVAFQGGVVSGGNYRLTLLTDAPGVVASGGGYCVVQSRAAALPPNGSGCCCTYLPCMLRRFP